MTVSDSCSWFITDDKTLLNLRSSEISKNLESDDNLTILILIMKNLANFAISEESPSAAEIWNNVRIKPHLHKGTRINLYKGMQYTNSGIYTWDVNHSLTPRKV